MVKKYIPKKGDIFLKNFNPTKRHEQADIRLAVVVSSNVFNQYTKMVIVCPIISNEKEFPTHYKLEDTNIVRGSVLCEHIRSINYEKRDLKFVEKLSDNDFISIVTLLMLVLKNRNKYIVQKRFLVQNLV